MISHVTVMLSPNRRYRDDHASLTTPVTIVPAPMDPSDGDEPSISTTMAAMPLSETVPATALQGSPCNTKP